MSRPSEVYSLIRTSGNSDHARRHFHESRAEERRLRLLHEGEKQSTIDAIHEVLMNPDLLERILVGSIGPWVFAQVGMVCKQWLELTRTSFPLLRSVSLYKGGVTQVEFFKLFACAPREMEGISYREIKTDRFRCRVYEEDAISKILKGGMEEHRRRVARRGRVSKIGRQARFCGPYCACTREYNSGKTHRALQRFIFESEEAQCMTSDGVARRYNPGCVSDTRGWRGASLAWVRAMSTGPAYTAQWRQHPYGARGVVSF